VAKSSFPKSDPRDRLLLTLDPATEPARPTFKNIKTPFWTKNKALLIERYLYLFLMVTKNGIYLDGFAAPQRRKDFENCAAHRVLTMDTLYLRRFVLCDVKTRNLRNLAAIEKRRPVVAIAGDVNLLVDEMLAAARITPKAAVCALLDQRTFECHWATVKKLAQFKSTGMKIELFYFLGTSWMDRAMKGLKDKAVVDAWYGGPDWRDWLALDRDSRVHAFCDRFANELNYQFVTPLPIYEVRGGLKIMYFMIHASDHPAASALMQRAYRTALNRRLRFEPKMLLDLPARAATDPRSRRRASGRPPSGSGRPTA